VVTYTTNHQKRQNKAAKDKKKEEKIFPDAIL
jgi:hypothetical protein